MAQISVIVAVYKMEEYLPRCVDGILGQTFSDLELILVDDGSPDGCGKICDDYSRKDDRVRVIHKQNAGVGAARNTGLDWVYAHSDSQWIFFHDNDDWVHPETLERLLDAAEKLDVKLAICGYQETEGEDPAVGAETLEPVLWKPEDFYRDRFVNATVCWGKLYHRSCFEGLRYPVGKNIEDEFLTYRILFAQERLAVIAAPLYAYYVNSSGITHRPWSPKRLDVWEAYEQQITFFEALGNTDMVHFRYRGYLDNAMVNLAEAENAEDREKLSPVIRKMKRRIRNVIRRAWRRGYIEFWPDYEMLHKLCPVQTWLYRFWKDRIRRGKRV